MTWLKQTNTAPAFPDMAWSQPERRDQAGKLLIVGGNQYGFSAPAEAFAAASAAGIGVSRVLLPSKLKSTVGALFPEAEFAPSTPSGSFARMSLAELLDAAAWSDGVLLAGDVGHNSETALVLESFISKHSGQITITQDVAEYVITNPNVVLHRPSTTLVLSMGQLQKLAKHSKSSDPITQAMGLPELANWLSNFTTKHRVNIVTKHLDHVVVAVAGQVSSTPNNTATKPWRVSTAARAATWWLQHPSQPFQAITTAMLETTSR